MWHDTIKSAHLAVTDNVSHAERLSSERYFVWMEDGRNDLSSDGQHSERAVTGRTDFFTKIEYDCWAEQLEEKLEQYGIAYAKRDTQYEDDTGFWHHIWDWEVLDDGEL